MNRPMMSLLVIGTLTAACAHEESAKTVSAPKQEAAPAPRQAARPTPPPSEPVAEALRSDGDAIYFDFDSSLVRDDARPVLQKVGHELRTRSESVKVEGNCDEVGTVEYNLALGEARARSAKEYLVHLGVPAGRIAIASYGSQRPKYPGHDEDAHAKNRRDDLLIH
jgi:peptidoglycan-associated lipoprotein